MKKEVQESVSYLESRVKIKPTCGIILGTGLGALVDEIVISDSIGYDNIPNFPISTVESHHGRLIFGSLNNVDVVVMQGRFHYYEGYSMQEVTFPVRVLKKMGVQNLFISNAAGGLNSDFNVSDLMIINDHIDLFPENPLRGLNNSDFGPRFPDMSVPYYTPWIDEALSLASTLSVSVHQGVYAGVSGPNLETKAEYKYLSIIGADAVGMSTIPENIVANHMGMRVFAVSVITDLCVGDIQKVTVEKVIAAAKKAEPALTQLIKKLVSKVC